MTTTVAARGIPFGGRRVRVLQSPMAACTDLPYRRIARRFGCGMAYCEMVRDRAVVARNESTMAMLATEAGDHPLGMQLLGRDPALLAEAAKILEGAGADVIDLNLGCPVNRIVADACGSALLREPEVIGHILEKLVPAVKIPVTIKMRTGFSEGDDDLFIRIVRIASAAGVAAITAHGRTRKQGFSGMANLDAIRAVKANASCPVVGNGNIRTGVDAVKMIAATGCDAVMVARGALGNPWIYRDIESYLDTGCTPEPATPAERAAVMEEHFRQVCAHYGDELGVRRMRRVVQWYVKGVPGSAEMRNRSNTLATAADFDAIVKAFAGVDVAACLPPGVWGAEGTFGEANV
jgi:tRNA-dihydrouridine synthase B